MYICKITYKCFKFVRWSKVCLDICFNPTPFITLKSMKSFLYWKLYLTLYFHDLQFLQTWKIIESCIWQSVQMTISQFPKNRHRKYWLNIWYSVNVVEKSCFHDKNTFSIHGSIFFYLYIVYLQSFSIPWDLYIPI